MVLCLLDPLDEINRFGSIFNLHRQQFEACLAARQRIAALVRQTSHHLAYRGEPFGLQEPFLRAFAIRDIEISANGAAAVTPFIQ
jgi:hypothetical protein